jgi:predicted acetyltransferase
MKMVLVRPALHHLPDYVAALQRGWSADSVRGPAAAAEELARIHQDPAAFVAALEDREAVGGPVTLPDGSQVPRLPGYCRWLWDGGFCGAINFRWQPGTEALPPHVLGHIGYAVVPWKQRQGHATRALALLLDEVRAEGLRFVWITTDTDNLASQRVIQALGGALHESFTMPAAFGGRAGLRYKVDLA